MQLPLRERPFVHDPIPPPPPLERIDGGEFRLYRTPDGDTFPSVTSVLGIMPHPELDAWRARVGDVEADRVSRAAAARGTVIHTLAEGYLNNWEVHASPIHIAEFVPMMKVLDKRIGVVRSTELPLYSSRLRVAGTTDCIAEFDGVMSLVDFKTSRRRKTKDDILGYFLQTSAYAMMAYEITGVVLKDIVIIMNVDGGECIVFKEKVGNYMNRFRLLRAEFRKAHSI